MAGVMIASVSVLLFAAFWIAVVAAGQMLNDRGRLRLHRAMELNGICRLQTQGHREAEAAAVATRQCVGCTEQAQCDLQLAQHDWLTLRTFCPNRTYIESTIARLSSRRPEPSSGRC